MHSNFLDIGYLRQGTAQQQKAHAVLMKHALLTVLGDYSPVLVGTIPINIDIPSSDLDIICYCKIKEDFRSDLIRNFSAYDNFRVYDATRFEPEAVVCNFLVDDFAVEVFGQNTPVTQQPAYRHMLIEYRLLAKYSKSFRAEIIKLKEQGLKTEPAFARLLGLHGDPYTELLKLEDEV